MKTSSRLILLLSVGLFAALACRLNPRGPANSSQPTPAVIPSTDIIDLVTLTYVTGRNDYTIVVDETPREFLVYVPSGYSPDEPTPLVFFYHGSNQGGPLMYEGTSWADVAERENFIVVFPTSWKYPTIERNGGIEDKWNTYRMDQQVVAGTELKDDVKFTRTMLDLLKSSFNIDPGRVFAAGFSNGSGFVQTRLILEMGSDFAAFAGSGSGLFSPAEGDVQLPSGYAVDLYVVIGTRDDKISEGLGHPLPFPSAAPEVAADPLFADLFSNTTTLLSLSPDYTVQEDEKFTTFTFNESLTGEDNVFIFRMVKGMFHVFADGTTIPKGFDAAALFWDFFMERTARE